jgi:hypothetical protein
MQIYILTMLLESIRKNYVKTFIYVNSIHINTLSLANDYILIVCTENNL